MSRADPDRDDPLADVPEGPVPSSRSGDRVLDLIRVMARLRAPGGCPWDHEQTHATLAPHLLEEAHEALQAIDDDDLGALREELGDVLLQVAFHAQIAADDGSWDIDDVAEGIVTKLIRRHPHVFGDVEVTGADEVLTNWEQIKANERGGRTHLEDDIPSSLPALARAAKVQRRAAHLGIEWRSLDVAASAVRDRLNALAGVNDPRNVDAEVGDLLFAAVAAARSLGVDAETALRRTTTAFADRSERLITEAEDSPQ